MCIRDSTKNMEVNVTDDNIGVRVDYELNVNHEPLADCKIKMDIYSKGSDPFS